MGADFLLPTQDLQLDIHKTKGEILGSQREFEYPRFDSF